MHPEYREILILNVASATPEPRLQTIPPGDTPTSKCLSNIRNVTAVRSKRPKPTPATLITTAAPWAKNWEKYFEAGWDKPQEDLPPELERLFK